MGVFTETRGGPRPGLTGRAERRRKARLAFPFGARVVGRNAEGAPFEAETVLDNLCANGAYFRLPVRVADGARLLVTVRLRGGEAEDEFGLEFYGSVVRIEAAGAAGYGLALCFANSIFI